MNDARRVPTYDQMLWPALQTLQAMGGSGSNAEHLDEVVRLMKIPKDVQNVPHGEGPKTEVAYRLSWARTYLRKVGAVENSRQGVWSVTAAGRQMTEKQVAEIPARVRQEYRAGREPAEGDGDASAAESAGGPEPDDWRERLLGVVKGMAADAFERLAQRILRESGFTKVDVTGRSGDGGIDGIGVLRIKLVSFQFRSSSSASDTATP